MHLLVSSTTCCPQRACARACTRCALCFALLRRSVRSSSRALLLLLRAPAGDARPRKETRVTRKRDPGEHAMIVFAMRRSQGENAARGTSESCCCRGENAAARQVFAQTLVFALLAQEVFEQAGSRRQRAGIPLARATRLEENVGEVDARCESCPPLGRRKACSFRVLRAWVCGLADPAAVVAAEQDAAEEEDVDVAEAVGAGPRVGLGGACAPPDDGGDRDAGLSPEGRKARPSQWLLPLRVSAEKGPRSELP
mmetsp:Transcript_42887/g.87692  ORF Transcript_42887/g.87692 Transcript_42887/m.87692 type:complete len:254 (-) Transcript_42887:34-795(-)